MKKKTKRKNKKKAGLVKGNERGDRNPIKNAGPEVANKRSLCAKIERVLPFWMGDFLLGQIRKHEQICREKDSKQSVGQPNS